MTRFKRVGFVWASAAIICIFSIGFVSQKPAQAKGVDDSIQLNDLKAFLDGQSTFYKAEVNSVFCETSVCSVVPVTLVWDELGRFQRFELNEGTHLEKNEGKPFDDSDYEKLLRILKDPDSQLRNLNALMVDEHGSGLSSSVIITQATPPVQRNSYVDGALWTCYTLWQYANGPMMDAINKMTASSLSDDELLAFLSKKDSDYIEFALSEMRRRGCYETQYLEAALRTIQCDQWDVTRSVLKYLEGAPENQTSLWIFELFREASGEQRAVILNQLPRSFERHLQEILLELEPLLLNPKSFQEVEMYLALCDKMSLLPVTLKTLETHENALISRRIRWMFENASENSKSSE